MQRLRSTLSRSSPAETRLQSSSQQEAGAAPGSSPFRFFPHAAKTVFFFAYMKTKLPVTVRLKVKIRLISKRVNFEYYKRKYREPSSQLLADFLEKLKFHTSIFRHIRSFVDFVNFTFSVLSFQKECMNRKGPNPMLFPGTCQEVDSNVASHFL